MSGSTIKARGFALAAALLLPSLAHAGDGSVSAGLAGGGLFTDQLEVIGDTLVITPRFGYWINPTLGFELDANVMPIGKTQVGAPETFGYFAALPAANMVGRVFEDKPLSLLLEVGIGPMLKQVSDDGALDLPVGTNLDVDFAGLAGPGLFLPFGKNSSVGLRTEYRWMLNIGTENWQNHGDAFINGEWTLGLQYLKSGPKDADKDGIVDDVDQCDDQAEDKDEFQDDDGCPDLDNDSDGVADTDDQCKADAEDKDSFDDADGCPDPDNDADGVLDAQDQCPTDKGTAATNGCPDTDGDGSADNEDPCPNDKGAAEADYCPDRDGDLVPDMRDECPDEKAPDGIDPSRSDGCPKKFYIAADKIVILEKVQFDTGKSVIKPVSFELLDGVADILAKNPGIKKLQVEGHTDSQGSDEKNMTLSQQRADSVKAYLVGKGIAEERLVAKGYGETKPVGDNATAAGREQNRRVEFNILEQDLGKRLQKKVEKNTESGKLETMEPAPAPAPEPKPE